MGGGDGACDDHGLESGADHGLLGEALIDLCGTMNGLPVCCKGNEAVDCD